MKSRFSPGWALLTATGLCSIMQQQTLANPAGSFATPTQVPANHVTLPGKVKVVRFQKAHETKVIVTKEQLRKEYSHQYYIVFTQQGQRAEHDCARGVVIVGDRGSIVATNGDQIKVVAGKATVINQSADLVTVSGAMPAQNVPAGASLAVAGVIAGSGETSAAQPKSATNKGGFAHGASRNEPLHLWASEDCQFGVTGDGVIELLKGEALIHSAQPAVVRTFAGTITCDAQTVASVRALETGLFVENASFGKKVSVSTHGHTIDIGGLHSAIFMKGAPSQESVPEDGVLRRRLYAAWDGYMTVFQSELNPVSLFKKHKAFAMAAGCPMTSFEDKLLHRCLKETAIVYSLFGEPEDYATKPQMLAVIRLGKFFNPYGGGVTGSLPGAGATHSLAPAVSSATTPASAPTVSLSVSNNAGTAIANGVTPQPKLAVSN